VCFSKSNNNERLIVKRLRNVLIVVGVLTVLFLGFIIGARFYYGLPPAATMEDTDPFKELAQYRDSAREEAYSREFTRGYNLGVRKGFINPQTCWTMVDRMDQVLQHSKECGLSANFVSMMLINKNYNPESYRIRSEQLAKYGISLDGTFMVP
jgi:hypothetical protein